MNPVMPFGKHRCCRVSELPSSYLRWLVREVTTAEPYLRAAWERELVRRCGRGQERAQAGTQRGRQQQHGHGDDWPRCRRLAERLQRWFREQALRHHPDRGGAHEVMVALGQVHDSLAELLRAS